MWGCVLFMMIDHFKLGVANRTLVYRQPEKNRKTGAEIRSLAPPSCVSTTASVVVMPELPVLPAMAPAPSCLTCHVSSLSGYLKGCGRFTWYAMRITRISTDKGLPPKGRVFCFSTPEMATGRPRQ